MRCSVTLGVDTHADSHVAFAVDDVGRSLGSISIPATPSGYRELLSWVSSFGDLHRAGVEGTGSYGFGLTRFLISCGVEVLEVERPNRQHRRRFGKSDTTDAESAARSVLAGTTLGTPKSSRGPVEMIRVLRSTRRSAVKARTQCRNQIHALLLTSPGEFRETFSALTFDQLLRRASRFRVSSPSDVSAATKLALRTLARRYTFLTAEISFLDQVLARLVTEAAPQLVALPGVGTDSAAALLLSVGDNPSRLLSESSFAHLCGVAPIAASSGKTVRYRLNRGGNRDANRALHVVALSRMSFDVRTKEYVSRRTSEGKTKREIIRCLKRYIVREVYNVIISSPISLD